LNISFQGV